MAPVVADQHRHPRLRRRVRQTKGVGQRIRERLLDQHRDPPLDAGEAAGKVVLVGRGDDGTVRPDLVQHLRRIGEVGNPVLARQGLRLGRRIGDRGRGIGWIWQNHVQMAAADLASSDQAELEGRHAASCSVKCAAAISAGSRGTSGAKSMRSSTSRRTSTPGATSASTMPSAVRRKTARSVT